MAVIRASNEKKLTIQVNEGTSASPSIKNRTVGTGYWINPDDTTASDEKLYQLGAYFAALQVHNFESVSYELRSVLEED